MKPTKQHQKWPLRVKYKFTSGDPAMLSLKNILEIEIKMVLCVCILFVRVYFFNTSVVLFLDRLFVGLLLFLMIDACPPLLFGSRAPPIWNTRASTNMHFIAYTEQSDMIRSKILCVQMHWSKAGNNNNNNSSFQQTRSQLNYCESIPELFC